MKYIRRSLICFAVVFISACSLYASDQEANDEIKSAFEKMRDGKYSSAAGDFLDAELYADETFLKARSVKMATECYRKAGLKYKEFKCLEKLINSYPTHVDYAKAVDREFELGDLFYQGERDPLFGFISWAKDVDRTKEVYETALKHGPFAKRAPEARLRLGRIYIDNQEQEKALKTLRQVTTMYPGTKAQEYAYFELAFLLVQLSEKGDGDGKYGTEAVGVLQTIKEKYPRAPGIEWVKQSLYKVQDITADRLYNIAKFYHRIGRNEPAVRYLNDVVKGYPDADVVNDSEALLASIDSTYTPPLVKRTLPVKYQLYDEKKMPVEAEPIMIVPENSNGKWLLPIRDLELGEIKKIRHENKEEDLAE